MKRITSDQLTGLVAQIRQSDTAARDAHLDELLRRTYPRKRAQDN